MLSNPAIAELYELQLMPGTGQQAAAGGSHGQHMEAHLLCCTSKSQIS